MQGVPLVQYQHTVTLTQSSVSNRQRRERGKSHMLCGRKNAFVVMVEEIHAYKVKRCLTEAR